VRRFATSGQAAGLHGTPSGTFNACWPNACKAMQGCLLRSEELSTANCKVSGNGARITTQPAMGAGILPPWRSASAMRLGSAGNYTHSVGWACGQLVAPHQFNQSADGLGNGYAKSIYRSADVVSPLRNFCSDNGQIRRMVTWVVVSRYSEPAT
jgi:hypothetical protein